MNGDMVRSESTTGGGIADRVGSHRRRRRTTKGREEAWTVRLYLQVKRRGQRRRLMEEEEGEGEAETGGEGKGMVERVDV